MSRAKLKEAIQEGNAQEVARLLAREPALATKPFKEGFPPLHYAALNDRAAAVTALLDAGVGLESVDSDGNTALGLAARHACAAVARLLLSRGANIHHRNRFGSRPLNGAAAREEDGGVEIVGMLLDAGADFHSLDGGYTPLMCACRGGRVETMDRLLEAGADVNELTDAGTALHIAIDEDNDRIVEYLLNHGADHGIKAPNESPPLDALQLAEKFSRRRSLRVLRRHLGLDGKPTASAQLTWDQFLAGLPDGGRAYGFRKPAPPEAVTNLEEAIATMLPEEFRDYLFINNGQKETADPLVPPWLQFDCGYRLLGAREILGQWKMMHKVKAGGNFDDGKPSPDKGIQSIWWDEGWVPFADNFRGDYVCLDLHPTKHGKRGQVIHFNHESGRRLLLAKSFGAWLAELAQNLVDNDVS